jgi:hypothetical protein
VGTAGVTACVETADYFRVPCVAFFTNQIVINTCNSAAFQRQVRLINATSEHGQLRI